MAALLITQESHHSLAQAGNAEPVNILFSAQRHSGPPVTGLALADFWFKGGLVPAGGSAPSLNHVHEAYPGFYLLQLVPPKGATWDSGVYISNLQVTDSSGRTALEIVKHEIP